MSKKVLIGVGLLLLIVILVGCGLFLIFRKGVKPQPVVEKTEETMMTPEQPQTLQGTLKDLFASGKSVKCSFDNSATDSAKVTGIVYVSGGKVRGDFATNTKTLSVNSHMIVDSGTSYIWTDMSKQGMKFALTDQTQQPTSAGKSQAPDLNQQVSYTCQDWTATGSMFVLPSDITFASISGSTSACAACDYVPAGASRDACKTQLHCP